MKFSDVPGLEALKNRLVRSVQDGKVPHAMLFQGKAGALNLPLALAFSTYLHCESRSGEDACGAYAACTLSRKFIHPDTHFVYPVGNMKTELKEKDDERLRNEILKMWREFLTKEPYGDADDWISFYGGEDKQPIISREDGREILRSLALKPFQSRVKVMIVWQPEMMHASAANGILKILEEPPPHTYFILVTHQAGQLMPTILSRTQIVTVPLTEDGLIRAELTTRGVSDASRLERLVGLAAGDIRAAIRLASEEEGAEQQVFQEFMRSGFRLDPVKLLPMSEQFHAADRMEQRNLLLYGLSAFRETLIALSGAHDLQRARGAELEFIRKFSTVLSVSQVEKLATLFNDALYQLERNGSAKMIFMDLALSVNKVMKG